MRLPTGKRIGQSRQELLPAVVFSFFLHILVFLTALFLYQQVVPRVLVPPAYQVALVNLPADLAPEITAEPKQPRVEEKKAVSRAKPPAGRKGAMPELKEKPAPRTAEPEYVAEDRPPAPAEKPGRPQGGVAVSAPEEFKFAPYVVILREKIERNWNPPPGVKGLKATVAFRLNRSGRVTETDLQGPSGNFYFDQAAMRAILSSSPFPPLPDGYFRDSMVCSVDLMANE